jgi:hypothetical protein
MIELPRSLVSSEPLSPSAVGREAFRSAAEGSALDLASLKGLRNMSSSEASAR